MSFHVSLGQLDADGETLHDQDDAREFERDLVGIAPGEGVDEIGGMRTEDDADDRRDCCFANVEFLFDDQRAQHEQASEASEDDVHQMGLVDREVFPRHLVWGEFSCRSSLKNRADFPSQDRYVRSYKQ